MLCSLSCLLFQAQVAEVLIHWEVQVLLLKQRGQGWEHQLSVDLRCSAAVCQLLASSCLCAACGKTRPVQGKLV